MKSAISVIGLGAMGTALAGAFLNNGIQTTVWNRTPEKAAALVARGAARAGTAPDAVSASPLVVVCVLGYSVVREILEPAGDALAGRVLVNLTTGTPEEARRMSGWAVERGAGYLDGGIMAIPSMIARPEAVLLYSGSAEAYQSHRDTLSGLGAGRYLGEDPGLASLIDHALLAGMYGMFGGFLHAVALAGTEGVEATEFTSSLLIPWLRSMIASLPEMAHQIDSGDYASKEANLAMQAANDTVSRVSEAQGVSAELFAPLDALMKRRVAGGHGGDDLASVIELIRNRPAA